MRVKSLTSFTRMIQLKKGEQMIKLKFNGKAYSGMDPENNFVIRVTNGSVIEVSNTKAEQLLKDFPKDWSKVDGTKTKETEQMAETIEEAIEEVEPEKTVETETEPEPKSPKQKHAVEKHSGKNKHRKGK